jgi:hypothetical protein
VAISTSLIDSPGEGTFISKIIFYNFIVLFSTLFTSPDCSGNPFFDSLGAKRKANQKKIATKSGIKLLII